MALITTIQQFRKYVKIAASATDAGVLPDFTIAENRHLVPLLGPTLYNSLNENISSPDYAKLLEYSRAIVAPMAMYYDLPLIQANITDTGVKVMSTDQMQAAPKWMNRDLREGLLEKASFASESILIYLSTLPSDAPITWGNPAFQSALFKTGEDFNRVHTLFQPFRTLLQLLPMINEVEDLYIRPTFGEDFYNDFKSAAPMQEEEKKFLELIKKAVANLAIARAVESLTVKVTPYGFTVKMGADPDDPYQKDQQAPDRQLEIKRTATLETGKRFLDKAKTYIDKQASTSLFADYFNSELYIAPGTQPPEDMNASFTGIFVL